MQGPDRSHANEVRLFLTVPQACGYFADRVAQNIVVGPGSWSHARTYDLALTSGFRRSGDQIYRPRCEHCQACIACRVPVERFTPDRSQRRCAARNADLHIRVAPAAYSDEHFALYRRYLLSRHRDGGMDDASTEDFSRFLYCEWSPTEFIEMRVHDRLVAVAVTDTIASGMSAVYTYFDPDEAARGLGTFAILQQIELARRRGLPHLYLGFWIEGHPKMHYKARFQPLEILRYGQWIDFCVSERALAGPTPP